MDTEGVRRVVRRRGQPRFVFTAPVEPEVRDRLESRGAVVEENESLRGDELRAAATRADVLVTKSWQRIDRALLERAAKQLRFVVQASAGADNIDAEAARQAGIEVLSVDPGNATAVAELTVASAIVMLRGLAGHWRRTAAGEWPDRDLLGDREARGRTLGLVGIGRVGSRVSRRALGLEMLPIAYDPYVSSERFSECGAERVPSLEALLERAEILSIHCPLTDETRGMIRGSELALLPGGAWLVNTARGGIVDENALIEALDSNRLAGAALDVFAVEPPGGEGLAGHPRVLATPHLAGHTHESHEARRRNLVALLEEIAHRLTSEKT